MKTLMLAAALSLTAAPAFADPSSNNPYEYTCGDLLAAETPDERVRANMMLMWSVGYMFGRFDGGPNGILESDGVMGVVNDMGNAMHQICPNVPDLSIGSFAQNLADDLASSMEE